jgi:hypothetical protein
MNSSLGNRPGLCLPDPGGFQGGHPGFQGIHPGIKRGSFALPMAIVAFYPAIFLPSRFGNKLFLAKKAVFSPIGGFSFPGHAFPLVMRILHLRIDYRPSLGVLSRYWDAISWIWMFGHLEAVLAYRHIFDW